MRSRTLALLVVFLTIFLDWVGIGLVYPMFSAMIFDNEHCLLSFDCSQTMKGVYLGMLLGSMPFAQFLSSPILGMLSDQRGRKKIILSTLYLAASGYLVCFFGAYGRSIVALLIGRFIVGIAAGNFSALAATVADLSTPEKKAKNFALLSMFCGLGFAVGPFLGGWLSIFGFEWPFLVALGATLINSQLVRLFFQETHTASARKQISFLMGFHHLKAAFARRGLRVIFLQLFFFCLGWSFFYEFISVSWIKLFDATATDVGMLYAYSAGFYVLSSGILVRPILHHFRPEAILFYALCGESIVCALMVHSSWAMLFVYLPLSQFFLSCIWPTTSTLVSNSTDKNSQGEVLGLMHSVDSAAFGVSPLFAGPLLGITPTMPSIIGSGALAIGALILLVALHKKALSLK